MGGCLNITFRQISLRLCFKLAISAFQAGSREHEKLLDPNQRDIENYVTHSKLIGAEVSTVIPIPLLSGSLTLLGKNHE